MPRSTLVARAFRAKHADESHRARLRVEIGRLRAELRTLADVSATKRGFALAPRRRREVVVLAPPVEEQHAAVLAFLADGELWSSSALAIALGASPRTVQRALDSLAAAGKVQSFGRGRARRWMTPPVTGIHDNLVTPRSAAERLGLSRYAKATSTGWNMKHLQPKSSVSTDPFRTPTSVHGVTFDGQHVWFATGDKLNAFDPASGKMLRSIDVAAHAGTAFDGQHLFQIAEDRIQKIDPKTGRVLATIPAPGGGGDSGLAWAEGTLWVGQHRDRKIHQIDPANRGDPSHHRVQPLRHRGHLGRRRALARHLGR